MERHGSIASTCVEGRGGEEDEADARRRRVECALFPFQLRSHSNCDCNSQCLYVRLELALGERDLLTGLEGWHAKVRAGRAPEGIAEVALKIESDHEHDDDDSALKRCHSLNLAVVQ